MGVRALTKLIYLRLAMGNLWKNRQTYLPFLTASVLLIFSMYSFLMITFDPGLAAVHGGVQFMTILGFGAVVVALFAGIFLFYANSFLIKRRKREMGLYSILGMEKKHIGRVIRHELSLTWLMAMVLGLALGILLSRLLFLLIRLAIRIDVPLVGSVSVQALWLTTALFAGLFLLLMLYNSLHVRMTSPIQLFKGGQTGEKEPKARWPLAVLGVLCMGGGYAIAQMVQNPMAAIALFFVAVVLVIVGTYLLFLSGSIAVLKLLKRNRRYYYQPRHFVTVSGMLYRMKQNAAGLASIAILCTMAMVTIGTTVAMYAGSEKMLTEYYPSDMQISLETLAEQQAVLTQNDALAARMGVTIRDQFAFRGYETTLAVADGQMIRADALTYRSVNDYGRLQTVLVLTQDAYAMLEGAPLDLASGEAAFYSTAPFVPQTFALNGQTLTMRRLEPLAVVPCMSTGSAFYKMFLFVPDDPTAQAVLAAAGNQENGNAPVYTVQWNITGDEAAVARYTQAAGDMEAWHGHNLRVKDALRQEWYSLHGGFLFMGIFLGLIFLMGTALIIYFKQISEGYQDHDRFIILQQVGMSGEEVRATVRRQILLVFFLPLLVAVCHVAGALHMISLMLALFGLLDLPYIAMNSLGAAVGVALLYWLFYHNTAKTYYKMVKF